jgi:hypothetical protein
MGGIFSKSVPMVATMTSDLLNKQEKDKEAERQTGLARAEDEIKAQRAQPKFKRASQRLLANQGEEPVSASKKLLGE